MTTDRTEEVGIHCPGCGDIMQWVAETRKYEDCIKRVRVCVCGARFVTVEKFEKLTKKYNAISTRSDETKPRY